MSMMFLQYNIQSLTKNKNNLKYYLIKYDIDICLLSETLNFDES